MNVLKIIQQKLKAPKSQFNKFGNYNFRNQEDILEAVKPLLEETDSTLILSDDIVELGGSLFLKATALLEHEDKRWYATAFAKHANEQKGMQDSQITGSTSSYARKYALNGLFLIDDTKDSDSLNTEDKKKPETKPEPKKPIKKPAEPQPPTDTPKELEELTPTHKSWAYVAGRIKAGVTLETIQKTFRISEENQKKLTDEKSA